MGAVLTARHRRLLLVSIAALIAGCGGGGSASESPTPAPSPTGPTPAEIAAEQAESTRLLQAYITQMQAGQFEAFISDRRTLLFQMTAQGLNCGSTHIDLGVALIRSSTSRAADLVTAKVFELHASRRTSPEQFGATLLAFQDSQEANLFIENRGCSAAWVDLLAVRTQAAIEDVHSVMRTYLRSAGLIS